MPKNNHITFLCGGHFDKKKTNKKVGEWMRNGPNNVRKTMTCDAPGCKACLKSTSPKEHYMWVLYRNKPGGYDLPMEYSHTHPGWNTATGRKPKG